MNVDDVNTLIRNRRSVFPKDYTGEKISEEVIWQLLENANWAPTHKLTEPWRFKVFCGDGLKVFADYQAENYHNRLIGTEKFLEKKYQKLQNNPLRCSHILSVGMHRDPDSPIREIEEIEAVACAVQNILLTAHAYKLGAYWSTGGLTYNEEAKAFFDLGSEDKLLGFIYLGRINTTPEPGKRNPIKQKVTWCTA